MHTDGSIYLIISAFCRDVNEAKKVTVRVLRTGKLWRKNLLCEHRSHKSIRLCMAMSYLFAAYMLPVSCRPRDGSQANSPERLCMLSLMLQRHLPSLRSCFPTRSPIARADRLSGAAVMSAGAALMFCIMRFVLIVPLTGYVCAFI